MSPDQVERQSSDEGTPAGWVSVKAGRHVLLAACRAEEMAEEIASGGHARGALSAALEWVLGQAGGRLTYRDLHKWVRGQVSEQAPQLECAAVEDYDRPFLGGAVLPRVPYFTLSFDAGEGWVIDAARSVAFPRWPGAKRRGAAQAIARLEHIATWRRLHELRNPAARIGRDAVAMEVFQVSAKEQMSGRAFPPGREIRVEYTRKGGRWRQPMVKVRLTNRSTERLYCALLDLTEDYGANHGLIGRGGEWLEPGQTAWANDGNPIYPNVPKALWQRGITEFTDLLKLIVSTSEFDAALLAQPALGTPVDRAARAARPPRNTLERLSERVHVRGLGTRPEEDEPIADWVTSQLDIVTVRPLDAVAVPRDGEVPLGPGISLLGYPALAATARLQDCEANPPRQDACRTPSASGRGRPDVGSVAAITERN